LNIKDKTESYKDNITDLLSNKKYTFNHFNSIVDWLKLYNKQWINSWEELLLIENILSEWFDYNIFREKVLFIRILLKNYNNNNFKINNLIINYIRNNEDNNSELLKEIWENNKIKIKLNNDFDKKIFEILDNKDKDKDIYRTKAQKIIISIDSFLNKFNNTFITNKSHSSAQWFWKWSWTYTTKIKTILNTLRINNWEDFFDYLERIKFLNFHNYFINTDNLDWTINNIMTNSKNLNLWFFDALENFWENSILQIKLIDASKKDKQNKNNSFSWLEKYYSNTFKKYSDILK
jgi:hypothetical protein